VALLRGKAERQGMRERGRLRRHLRELEDLREERLRDLGGLALEMHRREKIERSLLWKPAAEIAAIDDEAQLVRKGLDEGLSLAKLGEIGKS
jgi:hypothetical protein